MSLGSAHAVLFRCCLLAVASLLLALLIRYCSFSTYCASLTVVVLLLFLTVLTPLLLLHYLLTVIPQPTVVSIVWYPYSDFPTYCCPLVNVPLSMASYRHFLMLIPVLVYLPLFNLLTMLF